MIHYLGTLGLTLAVEVVVALFVIPRSMWRRRIGDVVLANLVTHPLATLAVRAFLTPWIVAEMSVMGAEAVIYRYLSGFGWRRAVTLSVACNLVTALLSFLV